MRVLRNPRTDGLPTLSACADAGKKLYDLAGRAGPAGLAAAVYGASGDLARSFSNDAPGTGRAEYAVKTILISDWITGSELTERPRSSDEVRRDPASRRGSYRPSV